MTHSHFLAEAYRVQIAQGKAYEELGPLSLEELQLLVEKGMLQGQSLYFDEKEQTWKSIQQYAQLFSKLFSKSLSSEDTYEVLFPKPDKPALKEAKALKEEELKSLYQQGILTPNSIVFDKEHKSWGPLRVYKKLYHKLNSNLGLKGLPLPAASKTLALRLAESNASPIAPVPVSGGEVFSKDKLSTASLHAKAVLPRIHDRAAQEGKMIESKATDASRPISQGLPLASIHPTALISPAAGSVGLPAASEGPAKASIYSALSQKPLSPSIQGIQGSLFQEMINLLGPYSRWFMGLSCLFLSALLYYDHKETWSLFWQNLSVDTSLLLGMQYPFVGLFLLNTLLGIRILNLFPALNQGVRFLLGLLLGGGLGYTLGLMHKAPLEGQVGGSMAFAVLGVLASMPLGRFSFGLARVSSLLVLGYLGYMYQVLGYILPLTLLSVGTISFYLGLYAYPLYTARAQHIVFLLLSVLILGQLCVLQFVF